MKSKPILQLISENIGDPLGLLDALDGLYICPKDEQGKRIGPLVMYAGKYPTADGGQKAYVGDIYANFAKAENRPGALSHFAEQLIKKIPTELLQDIVFAGPQMGGVNIAFQLALEAIDYEARYACVEKKTIAPQNSTEREKSKLLFSRHEIYHGDQVIISEDVSNNFFTTNQSIDAVEERGGKVIGITSLLNRSPKYDSMYEYGERRIPIFALVREPYPEYQQDDPEVIKDMLAGNVIIKPKDDWDKYLKPLMEKYPKGKVPISQV